MVGDLFMSEIVKNICGIDSHAACSMRLSPHIYHGLSLTSRWTYLRQSKRSKTSKLFGVIAVSNEPRNIKIVLAQGVSKRPILDSDGNIAADRVYMLCIPLKDVCSL